MLGQDRMWLCMRRSGLVLSQVSLGELDDDVRFNHAITMMVSTATLCSTLAEALQSSSESLQGLQTHVHILIHAARAG